MAAVVYARQSLDRDGSGAAIDRQLDACRDLAKRHKILVAHEYVDNDVSASKGVRPGFTALLASIKAGDVDTIITWHTDRLYRRVRDLVDIVDMAEKSAVRILTVRAGELDLTTPAGRMLAGMLGHAARYEVEAKGARQVAANRQRAEKGVWQFSRRPYGYRRVDGVVELVEDEAAVLREAYARYLDGDSYYAIVSDFNARGITTQSGGAWTISQLRTRLSTPGNGGFVVYQGEIVGVGGWEPIISRSVWDEYARMRTRRKTRYDWSNQGKHLLSGLLTCGVCGGRLFARPEYRTRQGERIVTMTYQCRDRWCTQRNLARTDDLVSKVIVARFSQPDVLELMKVDESTDAAEREQAELRQRWDDLAGMIADGSLRPQAAREQVEKIRSRIDSLQAGIDAVRDRSVMTDLALADDTGRRWSELSLPKKRALIQSMMTITVNRQTNPRVFDPNDIAIDWRS